MRNLGKLLDCQHDGFQYRPCQHNGHQKPERASRLVCLLVWVTIVIYRPLHIVSGHSAKDKNLVIWRPGDNAKLVFASSHLPFPRLAFADAESHKFSRASTLNLISTSITPTSTPDNRPSLPTPAQPDHFSNNTYQLSTVPTRYGHKLGIIDRESFHHSAALPHHPILQWRTQAARSGEPAHLQGIQSTARSIGDS